MLLLEQKKYSSNWFLQNIAEYRYKDVSVASTTRFSSPLMKDILRPGCATTLSLWHVAPFLPFEFR